MALSISTAQLALRNTTDARLAMNLATQLQANVGDVTLPVVFPPTWVLAQQRRSVALATFAIRHCNDPATLDKITRRSQLRNKVAEALITNLATPTEAVDHIVSTSRLADNPYHMRRLCQERQNRLLVERPPHVSDEEFAEQTLNLLEDLIINWRSIDDFQVQLDRVAARGVPIPNDLLWQLCQAAVKEITKNSSPLLAIAYYAELTDLPAGGYEPVGASVQMFRRAALAIKPLIDQYHQAAFVGVADAHSIYTTMFSRYVSDHTALRRPLDEAFVRDMLDVEDQVKGEQANPTDFAIPLDLDLDFTGFFTPEAIDLFITRHPNNLNNLALDLSAEQFDRAFAGLSGPSRRRAILTIIRYPHTHRRRFERWVSARTEESEPPIEAAELSSALNCATDQQDPLIDQLLAHASASAIGRYLVEMINSSTHRRPPYSCLPTPERLARFAHLVEYPPAMCFQKMSGIYAAPDLRSALTDEFFITALDVLPGLACRVVQDGSNSQWCDYVATRLLNATSNVELAFTQLEALDQASLNQVVRVLESLHAQR